MFHRALQSRRSPFALLGPAPLRRAPKPRRHAVLEDLQDDRTGVGYDAMHLIAIGLVVDRSVSMRVDVDVAMFMMMIASAEEQCTGDVDGEAQASDRDGLGKMDWYRREDAAYGLIADQYGYHCQDDGAREPRQVAQLAGPRR